MRSYCCDAEVIEEDSLTCSHCLSKLTLRDCYEDYFPEDEVRE